MDTSFRQKMSEDGTIEARSKTADYWILCYNGTSRIDIVAEGQIGESCVVLSEDLLHKFKEDL